MKPHVLIASLVFGTACWAALFALLCWLGLTPAQAFAVIVIVAGVCVLACFWLMERADG